MSKEGPSRKKQSRRKRHEKAAVRDLELKATREKNQREKLQREKNAEEERQVVELAEAIEIEIVMAETIAAEDAVAAEKEDAKATKKKNLVRRKRERKKSDFKTPHEKSVKKSVTIVPVTNKTEAKIQKWTTDVGKVGSTNATNHPQHSNLIVAKFAKMQSGKKHSESGKKYPERMIAKVGDNCLLTPHRDGHIPEIETVQYLCEKPRNRQKPLFYIKSIPVFTTMVYPIVVENLGENMDLFVSCNPKFQIPNWVLEGSKKMANLFIEDKNVSFIRVHSEAVAKIIAKKLNGGEKDKMGTAKDDNVWSLKGDAIKRPRMMSVLTQQEIVDIIEENLKA